MTRKEMKISDAVFVAKGRETVLNTHSLPDVVSHLSTIGRQHYFICK